MVTPHPMRQEPVYAYAKSAPLAKVDPLGLYTLAPGRSCPNMAAAVAEAQKRLGPATNAANKNCAKTCNPCRDRFCGCDVDDFLTQGTPPTIDFLSGWFRQGKTNCGGFPTLGLNPDTVYLDYDYCTSPSDIPGLASLLLHELTHWCNCQTPGLGGNRGKRIWGYPGQNLDIDPEDFEEGDYTEEVCK